MHGKMRNIKLWLVHLKGREYFKDLDIDGRIILEWLLENCCGKMWTEFIWLMIEISGGLS
jgi:hypothetical protein